jgi:hypothetical protein
MVNEGEDQHEHVVPEVVNQVEGQRERTDSETSQERGERFFKRHSEKIVLVVEATTAKLVMGLYGIEIQLDTLQGKALDGARKEEEAKDTRYRVLRNIGYVLYGLLATIIFIGKRYNYDWA